jgi:hypothetical protein
VSDRRYLVVALVAIAASITGLANDWAYDDGPMIHLNQRIHGLSNWRILLTTPFWPPPWHEEHYRPVTSLLLALQWTVGGGAPVVFRVTSYLLYAAVSVALYRLARRLLPSGPALAAALLFAAHPVHVEAVAPAVSQSELLVGLLAALMVIRYLECRRSRTGRLGRTDWMVLGGMYLVASLSKEHGMILPVLLLAAEVFLLPGGTDATGGGTLAARIKHLWPGYTFLAGIAAGVVLLRLALLGGQFSGQWTTEALHGLSLGGRVLTMLAVVVQWARLLVWPAHLRLDYAPQEMIASTGFGPAEAAGLVLVVATLGAIWFSRHRVPVSAFGLAWMVLALAPVSNVLIPTGSLIAERLLFLPSAGFLLAIGGAVAATQPMWGGRRVRRAVAVVCGGLVAAGVARSAERHWVWRHEAILTVRSVQDSPRSYRMQRAYGDVLFRLGEDSLALDAYRRALELVPPTHAWLVRNQLARRLWERGRHEEEVAHLLESLRQRPEQEDTRAYLIAAYLVLGRYDDAARESEQALARGPTTPEVFVRLRALADSAALAGAAPGTVRVGIRTGAMLRDQFRGGGGGGTGPL